jgi:hypothetical protein
MKRMLFQAFAVLSLLLFAATMTLWLRSYWRMDVASTAGLPSWSLVSTMGSATVSYHYEGGYSSKPLWTTTKISPTWNAIREHGLWFKYRHDADTGTLQMGGFPPQIVIMSRYKAFTLPYWPPTLLFAAIPLWWFLHTRRRATPGHCRQCNYDLRAHAPGQKCPECGTVIETPPTMLQSHP